MGFLGAYRNDKNLLLEEIFIKEKVFIFLRSFVIIKSTFRDSSAVERRAVNATVAGSIPAPGAK